MKIQVVVVDVPAVHLRLHHVQAQDVRVQVSYEVVISETAFLHDLLLRNWRTQEI